MEQLAHTLILENGTRIIKVTEYEFPHHLSDNSDDCIHIYTCTSHRDDLLHLYRFLVEKYANATITKYIPTINRNNIGIDKEYMEITCSVIL